METMLNVIEAVKAERARQDAKWGYPQQNAPFEWVSILLEEVGELAEAMNDAHLGPGARHDNLKAVKEAIQVAAVAVAMAEHLTERVQEVQCSWEGCPCEGCSEHEDNICSGYGNKADTATCECFQAWSLRQVGGEDGFNILPGFPGILIK